MKLVTFFASLGNKAVESWLLQMLLFFSQVVVATDRRIHLNNLYRRRSGPIHWYE